MLLETLSWMDVERYLERDDRIVVVTGACEQHGYVSLLTDVLMPTAIAEAACCEEPVLIAPPLPYGSSPYFTRYPGTVSLRPETFAAVVREVLGGLLDQGFRRILVSNGHGGNSGVLSAVLPELGAAYPEATLRLFHWWLHPDVVAAAEVAGYTQHHANWSENFPGITRLGPSPEGEKAAPDIPRGASAVTVRQLLGDGSYGGPYQAPEAVTEALFAAAVRAMVSALRNW